ncbi:DUF4334 domain-containing protein [Algiphilus sp.]|uniref:DUF4334 domain-containing protein n=1 Tax=Algiphilus sp. TaxID=1872431 RepID=UPI002A5E9310|nr:DUF4334 domain-containing protein [Pseudomonadota bacterium]
MPFDATQTLGTGRASEDEAFAFYDQLDPVDCDFMLGRWRGDGYTTGHALDGVLEAFGWYGKEFVDVDHVHPLLFSTRSGGIRKLNPALMPLKTGLRFPQLNNGFSAGLFPWLQPLLATGSSKARLRMTEYRGKISATMCYDQRPIHDVFRRVDDSTVLGAMDFKGMDQTLFFLLRREQPR